MGITHTKTYYTMFTERASLLWMCALLLVNSAAGLRVVPGKRVSHPMSIEEFQNTYAQPGSEARPVVLSGAAKAWPAMQWTLDKLKSKCGAQMLEKKCQGDGRVLRTYNPNSTKATWAGMQDVDGATQGINTVSDYVNVVHNGADLYLHDAGIDSMCPELLNDLRVPKYFQLDFQKQLPDDIRSRHKCNTSDNGGPTHPSIFLGQSRSVTGLHIDSRATRFWMAVLKGTKTFRLVNPRYMESLAPVYAANPNVVHLDVDLFAPDEQRLPSLRNLEVLEMTLHAGDIVFIPEGWPHQVVNEESSIAISYNYIDTATQAGHEEYLQNSAKYLTQGSADQTIAQLQVIWMKMSKDYPVLNQSYSDGDVSWSEFFQRQRPKVSAKSLFDNMTPEQSVESLKIMGIPAEEPAAESGSHQGGATAAPESDMFDGDDQDDDQGIDEAYDPYAAIYSEDL